MPPVDAEVGIRCENHRIGQCFGHPHKAGVGEAHWHIRVFLQELQDGLKVVVQTESGNRRPAAKQPTESWRPSRAEKVDGLRYNGLAGAPRWSVARRLRYCPLVVRVAAAK